MLEERDRTNIHFTDEDFFFDIVRAKMILEYIKHLKSDFKLIALVSRQSLSKFIEAYGNQILEEAGFVLFEVGLETASEDLGEEMGKGSLEDCKVLTEKCSVPILWLTLTFFPGETIQTLRATGQFLKEHGLNPEALSPRLRTNGTHGGLGQFFTPYVGTEQYISLDDEGWTLTKRPMRLIPSFIPDSFLNDRIIDVRDWKPEEKYWYDLYKVQPPSKTIAGLFVKNILNMSDNVMDTIISLAISARLGVIA
jgi:radical SAM superfamily enzyme YgiQ (UPF0313 family)